MGLSGQCSLPLLLINLKICCWEQSGRISRLSRSFLTPPQPPVHVSCTTSMGPSLPSIWVSLTSLYPVAILQRKYKHLRGLPFESFTGVSPLLLTGSDQAHLISPIEPGQSGPPEGLATIWTEMGWALPQYSETPHCLYFHQPRHDGTPLERWVLLAGWYPNFQEWKAGNEIKGEPRSHGSTGE